MLIIRKNPKLGNFVHFEHGWEAVAAGFERVEVGTDGEGLPIYENGDQLFSVDWNEAWGEPPTDEELEAWEEPEPEPASPLTDVERLAQGVALYRAANEAAKEIILTLMVKVSGAMINLEVVNAASEPITADNANDEGARFVAYHREAIVDYKQAGRNQVAANALYAAVSSEGSLTAFPWLEASGGIILGIFASELGVTP